MPRPRPARRPSDRRAGATAHARRSPALRDQPRDVVDADDRPTGTGGCGASADSSAPSSWCTPVPGADSSTTTRPPGREQLAHALRAAAPGRRRCRCCRRRAAPCPSDPRRAPGRRRRAAGRRRPRLPVCATASSTTSMPSATWPRGASASVIRPGPQPMSMVGPTQSASRSQVGGVGRAGSTGAPAGRAARRRSPTTTHGCAAQGVGEDLAERHLRRSSAPRRASARQTAANRVPGRPRPRVGVRDGVDVAQRGRVGDPAPARSSAARVSAPVSASTWPRRASWRTTSGVAARQRPPAAVGRPGASTASWPASPAATASQQRRR